MEKRPLSVVDSSEDSDEPGVSRDVHKHHHQQVHLNRDHRIHDTVSNTTPVIATTTGTTLGGLATPSTAVDTDEPIETTTGQEITFTFPSPTTVAPELKNEKMMTTTGLQKVSNRTYSRGKKGSRRQKLKDPGVNRTDADEGDNFRRRKVHHQRRNGTILTNSVHDDAVSVNTTDNVETISTLPETTPLNKHHHHHHHHHQEKESHSTVPSVTPPPTFSTEKSIAAETGDVVEHADKPIQGKKYEETTGTKTITFGTSYMQSSHSVPTSLSTGSIREHQTTPKSIQHVRKQPMATVTTTPRTLRAPRNRTGGGLGPARIDVTIVEPSDRKYKPGKLILQ